jgi:Domain of unknown function (DUF3332)
MKGMTLRNRIVAAVVAGSFLTLTTACYGPFNLTRNVYHWNSNIKGGKEVNEKWMKEIVFFGMIIIPVYMFSALLDAFIFNSIQFWSGDNPIKASDLDDDGQTKVAQVGDLTMRWTSTSEGATVTYERRGIIERRAMIVSSATGYRLVNEGGNTLAEVEYAADGTLTVLDHDCRVVQRWTDDQLRLLVQGHGASLGESAALLSIK